MKIKVQDFSLKDTVESGQIFRYEAIDNGYRIKHSNREFFVRQEGNVLEFDDVDEDFIRTFFSLSYDPNESLNKLKDKKIRKIAEKYKGIRIIKQDPWECIVSFICSQASNIPRIKRNLNDIAQIFGNGKFPKPGEINDTGELEKIKLGFRAKYLLKANEIVNEEFIRKIGKLDYEEAKELLKTIPGVADKVADCVLLFSYGFGKAFPVDTWIKKVMQELYFKKNVNEKKIREFAQKKFGDNAGYVQQYLYHYRRLK